MIDESKRLASYGRNGDNNLVHVSNRELAGIESLTGRRFTRNPHTGLPEAFGFEDVLPIIAGVVATIATEGAAAPAVYGALASGATGAAVSAAKGNDMTTALTSGLISGIGSYAGASALGGAAGAAGEAAGEAASQGAVNAAGEGLAQSTIPTGIGAASSAPTGGDIITNTVPAFNSGNAGVNAYVDAAAADATGYGNAGSQALPSFNQSLTERAGSNLQNVIDQPGAALGKVGENLTTMNGLKGAGMMAGSAYMASGLSSPHNQPQPAATPWNYTSRIPATNRTMTTPGSDYRPGISPEWRYFAGGGPVNMTPVQPPVGFIPGVSPEWNYFARAQPGSNAVMQQQAGSASIVMPPPSYRPGVDPEWNYFPNREAFQPPSLSQGAAPSIALQSDGGGSSGGGDSGDSGGGGGGDGLARGGLASLNKDSRHGTTANIINEAKAAMVGEHPRPQAAIQRFRDTFGDGAFQTLSERYGNGGKISGAGGGLDDLIPGTIEGKQKVRLADSEFVIPADVVSAIGDGSSDHGSRVLHEMMANVRKQKTGSTKQPGRLKPGTIPYGR